MPNIQHVVTARHDWQPQKLHRPDHPKADPRGFAMGIICMNCRKAWFEDEQGSPPLKGCLTDVRVKLVGKARQQDYMDDEMRMRSEQERFDPRDLGDLQTVTVSPEQFDRLREAAEEANR